MMATRTSARLDAILVNRFGRSLKHLVTTLAELEARASRS
jgi:hypothetical protein